MDMLTYMLLLFMLLSTSSVFVFHMLVAGIVMFNILELIMTLLPNFSTIQKPNCRQFRDLTMAGYIDAMKPEKFTDGMGLRDGS